MLAKSVLWFLCMGIFIAMENTQRPYLQSTSLLLAGMCQYQWLYSAEACWMQCIDVGFLFTQLESELDKIFQLLLPSVSSVYVRHW